MPRGRGGGGITILKKSRTVPHWERSIRSSYARALDKGRVMTFGELVELYKNETRSKSISANVQRRLRELKNEWLETAHFGLDRTKISDYLTIMPVSFGVMQADSGFFPKRSDSSYIGFLLLTCVVSGYSVAALLQRKTKEDYMRAFEEMFDSGKVKNCHTIQTDKDLSFSSSQVKTWMMDRFGIRMHLLSTNSKAFAVERAIGILKNRVSILQMRRRESKWPQLFFTVLDFYNDQKPTGSSFRRRDVTETNFLDYLDEVHGTPDITMHFNTASMPYSDLELAGWADSVFKFEPGERVALSRSQDKNIPRADVTFAKKTRMGKLSLVVYVVSAAELKTTRKGYYVPGK